MTLYLLKKKLVNSIFSILIFVLVCTPILGENIENETIIYDNKMIMDIMRISIPIAIVSGVLIIASNRDFRWYFADRWTRFTSPNHASPENAVPFYFRTWEEQISQKTQCDKGVHFIFSYLPVEPIAAIYDRTYYTLTTGKLHPELSNWSMILASATVMGFGILEEYMDGHQRNEGFDLFDLGANFLGVACALLKHYGYLKYVDFYWSFNKEMFYNSRVGDIYPWWIYMAGYEFYVNIDIMSLLTNNTKTNNIYNLIIKIPGYIPDLKRMINSNYR